MSTIKNENVYQFVHSKSSELKIIRSLLLFGKNTYTYKFAFCDAFLKIGPQQTIHQDDIFKPFIESLLQHTKTHPKQFTGETDKPSSFMKAFRAYGDSQISFEALLEEGAKVIPLNVFEAFQNLGGGRLSDENLLYDFDKKTKKFNLRPQFLQILENKNFSETIKNENQGRWRVVEEAWRLGIAPSLITFNEEDEVLYTEIGDLRVALRSAVDLLLPYQQGRCFYCNKNINRFELNGAHDFPDVDHFYSLNFLRQTLAPVVFQTMNPNGIWNLVISCFECNRGIAGKFEKIPQTTFVERLIKRNSYFAEEHKHAFRNAILLSLGVSTPIEIKSVIETLDKNVITERWKPKEIFE